MRIRNTVYNIQNIVKCYCIRFIRLSGLLIRFSSSSSSRFPLLSHSLPRDETQPLFLQLN